jgi:hypothetical protein
LGLAVSALALMGVWVLPDCIVIMMQQECLAIVI